ncbi:unnamed protein product [Wuchereria bancrofti]|uniref:AMP-dependent synthetase/ligase domain-containing protein n=1 Tax=Wuchereria bancrofti TaxID=6293 RepID=A0A3P7EYX0_WUCBA|nr:unnamed protein product [Wuchereria bancrofti]
MPIKSGLTDVDVPCIPFHEMIFSEMRRYGNEIALVNNDTDETFTFEDILLKTKYIANSLLAMGIEKGEPIILCVPNCPEFVWLFLGISLAGGIVCPLHPSFSKGSFDSFHLFFENLLYFPKNNQAIVDVL